MGGSNYRPKKIRPIWSDKSIDFHNIKSGYSKESSISLLIRYRSFESSSSVISVCPSPIHERSPYSSTKSLLTTSQITQTDFTGSSTPRTSSLF
ncbi:hypothetical protein LOD99_6220 [Oopsacas minuta]|uniref:Uncharacterized protein n=1 Tax=Oopsacas minuta TaxID=111878 RepID=A0AAV7JNI5_9METZ|nr:hypothetical protein LOD99_6220 [Oopsacas minuta]